MDVGTGCGFFLVAAQKRGWLVKGVEPSKQSVEVACRQNNLDVFCGTLQEYHGDDQYDVITFIILFLIPHPLAAGRFINVLDHSAEPWKEIKSAQKLLEYRGILYLRFPNGFLHTWVYRIANKLGFANRIHKFLVFHQFSLTPKFIKVLLSDTSFSEITIFNSPPSEGDPYNLFSGPAFAQYVKNALFLIAV